MAQPNSETPSVRDTKTAIRDAAIKLISAQGYEQTSLRQIADVVGISKASLYYHYPSKQDLLLAVASPVFDQFVSIVATAEALAYNHENADEVLSEFVTGMLRHREVGQMVMRDPSITNELNDRYPQMSDLSGRLVEWLAGPEPTVESRLRAGAAINVLAMALTPDYYAPGASDDEVARVMMRLSRSLLQIP